MAPSNPCGEISEAVVPSVLTIRAWIDTGTMARVANIFTVRGLIPAFLCCRRADPYLLIDVQLMPEDAAVDHILLDRLRALVCVDRVEYVSDHP